jgi:outer membrane protein, multidrug efflux system
MSKFIRTTRALATLTLAAAISGCILGPDYVRPQSELPAAFENAATSGKTQAELLAEYWTVFNDATLNALVADAIAANHDLRIAKARLAETRASRRASLFDLWPVITSKVARQRSAMASAEAPGAPASELNSDYYEAGFDASWETSLFGRGFRGVRSQNAVLAGAEAEYWGTQVSITAEVARQYFEYRGLQQRLQVARRNVDNQAESLKITEARLEAGRGTELDHARAQSQLEINRANIPRLETALTRARYRIAVLTGRHPQAQDLIADRSDALTALPDIQPNGDPVDLLRRRPDIMVAERNLAAQTELIGYRKAELFPRIFFSGTAGFASESFGDLGESSTQTWRFAPSITWSAFDLGRVLANVKVQRHRAEAALAEYEKSVLVALEDTDGALAEYRNAATTREHLALAANASADAARLARMRFDAGVTDFSVVLDVEAQQLQAEDQLAQAHTQSATALIAAFKALGGGWTK